MKEKSELRKQKDEKLKILMATVIAYFVFFILTEIGIITEYLGIIMLILLYMYANYNLINMFFTSKRTTFKVYAFLFSGSYLFIHRKYFVARCDCIYCIIFAFDFFNKKR